MVTCFPFIRYLFFITLFIISSVILKTSTTLEVVGFNVLNVFAALFGISIALDVLEYTIRPTSKHKYIAYLFSAGAILMFVGVLLTTVGYDKMVMEYAAEKQDQFKLDQSFRALIEEIKDISISTIALTIVSAIAIFYRWEDLREIFNYIIDPLLNTHLLGAWILRVLLCVVVISLGIALMGSESPYDFETEKTPEIKSDKSLVSMRVFFGIVFPLLMIFALLMRGNYKYFIMLVLGLFMMGFTAWLHGTRAKDPEYSYNHYEKPLYGATYVLAGLSILEAGSIYTPNAITALFKIGMPLATVGLSSYLVFLGNKVFELTRHAQIK